MVVTDSTSPPNRLIERVNHARPEILEETSKQSQAPNNVLANKDPTGVTTLDSHTRDRRYRSLVDREYQRHGNQCESGCNSLGLEDLHASPARVSWWFDVEWPALPASLFRFSELDRLPIVRAFQMNTLEWMSRGILPGRVTAIKFTSYSQQYFVAHSRDLSAKTHFNPGIKDIIATGNILRRRTLLALRSKPTDTSQKRESPNFDKLFGVVFLRGNDGRKGILSLIQGGQHAGCLNLSRWNCAVPRPSIRLDLFCTDRSRLQSQLGIPTDLRGDPVRCASRTCSYACRSDRRIEFVKRLSGDWELDGRTRCLT